MTDRVPQKPPARLLLLAVEGLSRQLAAEPSVADGADPLRTFLSQTTIRRVDLFPTGGRNAIAFSLATGSDPLHHGMLRTSEPDPSSLGIRGINARSCRRLPFWTLLSGLGRSSVVLNWPSLMPASTWSDAAGSEVDGTLHRLVAPEAILSGRSRPDHWVLPHDSVHPEAFAPTVRSARVHPDMEAHPDPLRARIRSVDAIARAIDAQGPPDVMACWLVCPGSATDESGTDSSTSLSDLVMPMIDRAGDATIAVLDLPFLEDRHVQHFPRLSSRLHLANLPSDCSKPPLVMRDSDVVFTLLSALGLQVEPTPRADIDIDAFERRTNKRARLYLQKGWKPIRSAAQQRIHTRSVADKVGLLGMDQFHRGRLEQARPLLEQSLQSNFNLAPLICLGRTYLATGDHQRLGRLAALCVRLGIGTAFRSAELLLTGDREEALSTIETYEPTFPVEIDIKVELLARLGECEGVCRCLHGFQGQPVTLASRTLRIALVCARRTGDASLRSRLAREILVVHPGRGRLRRFLEA